MIFGLRRRFPLRSTELEDGFGGSVGPCDVTSLGAQTFEEIMTVQPKIGYWKTWF